MLASLLQLALLCLDALAHNADASAFVWLWRPDAADVGGNLCHLVLVKAVQAKCCLIQHKRLDLQGNTLCMQTMRVM